MAVPALFDGQGYRVTSGQFGASRVADAAQSGPERPYWPTSIGSWSQMFPTWDWRTLVSVSRKLYVNGPGVFRGMVWQKAMFAIGRSWDPQFLGGQGDPLAKQWGDYATGVLRDEWYPVSNVGGSMHNFKTDLSVGSKSVDVDGDFGILLTESEDGYPLLQYIPCHRIGQRGTIGTWAQVGEDDAWSYVPDKDGTRTKKVKGLYAGLWIENGIIKNLIGRPVAARILGATPEDDIDVSMRDFIHVYDPEFFDQSRGIPVLTHAANAFRDALQSQKWEQHAQLIASSLGLQFTNETGQIDASDLSFQAGMPANGPLDPNGPAPSLAQIAMSGGAINVFRAGSGSKFDSFAPQRPTELWNGFWDRIIEDAMSGANWPRSMVWKSGSGNAAAERSELQKAQSTVDERQDLLGAVALRCLQYGISKLINIGAIPPYPGKDKGGFLKWGFSRPERMTIDKGRDADNNRKNYQAGIVNMEDLLDGRRTLEQHLRHRLDEVVMRKTLKKEYEAKYGVEIDDRDLMMLNPNEQPDGAAGSGDTAAAEQDKKPGDDDDHDPTI